MLAQSNQYEPDPAASTLERLGISLPDELIPLLLSPDRRLAATACLALGRTAKKSYGPALLAAEGNGRP